MLKFWRKKTNLETLFLAVVVDNFSHLDQNSVQKFKRATKHLYCFLWKCHQLIIIGNITCGGSSWKSRSHGCYISSQFNHNYLTIIQQDSNNLGRTWIPCYLPNFYT
jgi:hypothetical protein